MPVADIAELGFRADTNELVRARDRLRAIGPAAKEAETATERMNRTFISTRTAVLAAGTALAGFAVGMVIRQATDATRSYQAAMGQLTTATGSAAAAQATYNRLVQFAATTPFSLDQSIEAFVKLKNLGLTPSERAMRSYGNTASAMGKDLMQMVEAVADAATGEFERLKEFGIRASAQGNQVRFTFQGVTTSVANNAAAIEGYLLRLGETKFGSAMSDQSKTLNGAISNLGDTWSQFMVAFGNGFAPALQEGVTGLSNMIGGSNELAVSLGQRLGQALSAVINFITFLIQHAEALGNILRVVGSVAVGMLVSWLGGMLVGALVKAGITFSATAAIAGGPFAASMIVARGAVGGLVAMLGGPLGIALAVATAAYMFFSDVSSKAATYSASLTEKIADEAAHINILNDALAHQNGTVDQSAQSHEAWSGIVSAAKGYVTDLIGSVLSSSSAVSANTQEHNWLNTALSATIGWLNGVTGGFNIAGAAARSYAVSARAARLAAVNTKIDEAEAGGRAIARDQFWNNPMFPSLAGTDALRRRDERANRARDNETYLGQLRGEQAGLRGVTDEQYAAALARAATPQPVAVAPHAAPAATGGHKPHKARAAHHSDPFGDIVRDSRISTSDLDMETRALGMTEEAASRLRAQTELLNKARQKELTLTPAQTAQLQALGIAAAEAQERLNHAKALHEIDQGFTERAQQLTDEARLIGLVGAQLYAERIAQEALNRARQNHTTLAPSEEAAMRLRAVQQGETQANNDALRYYDEKTRAATSSTAATQREYDQIGLSETATARLRYETELLNKAAEDGIILTPDQIEGLTQTASEMAGLEMRVKNLKDSFDFAKSGVRDFLGTMVDGLRQGKSILESLGDALNNLFDKLLNKTLDLAVNMMFSSGKGGAGSGLAGIINSIFHAKGAVAGPSGLQAFATGASFTNSVVSRPTAFTFGRGGRLGVMGEAGPEAIMPLKRGPNGSLGVQMHGGTRRGGSMQAEIHVHNDNRVSGAISSQDIVDMQRRSAEKTKDDVKKSLTGWIGQIQRDGAIV